MFLRKLIVLVPMCVAGSAAFSQNSNDTYRPVESEHVAGPHGLEGWTLNGPIPDDSNHETYPFTLVIARSGRILRKIEGDGFVWHWIYWNDGRQIAYESGPLHFSLSCNLYDLATGRDVKTVDCFHGIPENAPAWLIALEKPRQP